MPINGPTTVAFGKEEDGAIQVEVTLPVRQRRERSGNGGQSVLTPPPVKTLIPRVTRLLALAIKFQDMVDSGEVRDYADIARLGYVTRASLTQIMNLSLLAPDIQEAMLMMAHTKGVSEITERFLRKLTQIPAWEPQRLLWRETTDWSWRHVSQ